MTIPRTSTAIRILVSTAPNASTMADELGAVRSEHETSKTHSQLKMYLCTAQVDLEEHLAYPMMAFNAGSVGNG